MRSTGQPCQIMSNIIKTTKKTHKELLHIYLSTAQNLNGLTVGEAKFILNWILDSLKESPIVNFNPADYPQYDANFDVSCQCHE